MRLRSCAAFSARFFCLAFSLGGCLSDPSIMVPELGATPGGPTMPVLPAASDKLSFPAPSFRTGEHTGTAHAPRSVVARDVNGDTWPDLVVTSRGSVAVFLGAGAGRFLPARLFTTGFGPTALAVGDFNEDHKPDLALANSGSSDVLILLNGTP
jgi:hypothetical protein